MKNTKKDVQNIENRAKTAVGNNCGVSKRQEVDDG